MVRRMSWTLGGSCYIELRVHHDEDAVLCAIELALNAGAPTKTHILNLLHRLIDGKSLMTSTVEAPRALTDLMGQGSPAFEAAVPIISQLLKAETAEREVRSVAYQIKATRFPAYKDLTGFDFTSSEVNEGLVRQLHRCEFIDNADNVVLVGGPGTGKTHLAPIRALTLYYKYDI